MVRFQSSQRHTPDYLSRYQQWRLLALVLAVGLVLFLMRQFRQPENAAALNGLPAAAPATQSKKPVAKMSSADQSAMPPAKQRAGDAYVPGVPANVLSPIKDNTYFRTEEAEAWFHLIGILQSTDPAELKAASIGEADYVQLVEQPHMFRGQVVAVRGSVRRVEKMKPAGNDLGLQSYYRLTIRPRGGGIWPIMIYSLKLPEGFPMGDDLPAEVAATGFFFKNWSYLWQDGVGLAPTLLTKNVEWLDRPASGSITASGHTNSPIKVILVGGALAAVLLMLAVWNSGRWKTRHRLASGGNTWWGTNDASEQSAAPEAVGAAMQRLDQADQPL